MPGMASTDAKVVYPGRAPSPRRNAAGSLQDAKARSQGAAAVAGCRSLALRFDG